MRQLISEGQPKVAAELARKALAEFGQHPGLHEAFEEAERGYASQVEKARQRDTIAAEIQAWCRGRYSGSNPDLPECSKRRGDENENVPPRHAHPEY